jgi:Arm DNA-binding domain
MGVLSDQICASARCDQQRILKLADGDGLYLWVYSDGRKYWRYRYRQAGKENSLSLGVHPHVSIDDARNERDQSWTQLKNGLSPAELRKDARRHVEKPSSHRNQFRLMLANDGGLALRVFLQATVV